METLKIPNGLQVSPDYLGFTFMQDSLTVSDVIHFLGYQDEEFQMADKGMDGYTVSHRNKSCKGLVILSEGSSKTPMGIHVNAPGSCLGYLFSHVMESRHWADLESSIQPFFAEIINNGGQFSRIDLALDDYGTRYWSPEEFHERIRSCDVSSKFRKCRGAFDENFDGEKYPGYTLYLGTRKSPAYVRIYDKQAEQNQHLKEGSEGWVSDSWTRWEYELKDHYAERLGSSLASGASLASAFLGLLRNQLKLHVPGTGRKDRRDIDSKWLEFLQDAEKASLWVRPEEKSIDQNEEYLEKQASRLVAKVCMAKGTPAFLAKMLHVGLSKMTGKDQVDAIKYMKAHDLSPNMDFYKAFGIYLPDDSDSAAVADPAPAGSAEADEDWLDIPSDEWDGLFGGVRNDDTRSL